MPELLSDSARSESVDSEDVRLAVSDAGPEDGRPIVLLHGLSSTRDYVPMATHKLMQSGHRVIAFDARGHGSSSRPSAPDRYGYDLLLADLVAVLDAFGLDRVLLVGTSMGALTALRLALEQPGRVAAIAAVTPAYDSDSHPDREAVRKADVLAEALRRDGLDGFLDTFEFPPAPETRTAAYRQALERQLGQHEDLDAVADALELVMRAAPFESLDQLRAIDVPTAVIASRDEFDAQHPHAVATKYAGVLSRCEVVCEEAGRTPLAWKGSAVAKVVRGLSAEATW